jgi:hypothetical protein
VTQQQPDLDAVARAILDANHHMTLGTADAAGRRVVFDPQAPVGTGQAVYLAATAAELSGADLERGLRVYPGEAGRRAGARTMTPEDVLAPSVYRLYRATASRHWVLDPNASPDQRTPVNP